MNHQIVSTAEQPLPCIRCGVLLAPDRWTRCPACVEVVLEERRRAGRPYAEASEYQAALDDRWYQEAFDAE